MKTTLLLYLLICTKFVLGQTSTAPKYNATFKLPVYVNNGTIDTVFVFNIKTKTQTKFLKLKQKGQTIVLDEFKTGKYLLTLAGTGYLIKEYPFVVCSKCTNIIDLTKFPNQRILTSDKFNLVAVDPSYVGGDAQLKTDFLNSYTKEEIQILKSIKQFKIQAFLTSKLEVCDITFIDTILEDSKKELLIKGLKNLRNWNSARTNGQSVDGRFIIDNLHLK